MKSPFAYISEKRLQDWAGGYFKHWLKSAREPKYEGTRHLLFSLCDHYEPLYGMAPDSVGVDRVAAWEEKYPIVCGQFRDADGFHPRHSFFFPGEEYRPVFLDKLANLVKGGFGEVELHLHHDADTPENLRHEILEYLDTYAQHGHLTRDADGRIRYAFIHGNWALCNARADSRFCGVDEELPLLFDTGCYADYTFPAAPSECQPSIVNQIYWPSGDLARKRAYETGTRARVGEKMDDRVLIIQGPLALNLRTSKLPPMRVENTNLTGTDRPSLSRIKSWVAQNIHVEGRPEWVFVKTYTHGAPEDTAIELLGDGGFTLHQELRDHFNDGEKWQLHYVTAREMYNIAIAAMDGKSGNPGEYRDYVLPPPPVCSSKGKRSRR
ncbi:MAG: hypothetical protein KC503_05530 [Myxococcales bacterium]|nr:hypothetical protein [Myxococcales bacterium]